VYLKNSVSCANGKRKEKKKIFPPKNETALKRGKEDPEAKKRGKSAHPHLRKPHEGIFQYGRTPQKEKRRS